MHTHHVIIAMIISVVIVVTTIVVLHHNHAVVRVVAVQIGTAVIRRSRSYQRVFLYRGIGDGSEMAEDFVQK